KYREQSAAALERAQEASGGGTAEGIEDEIDVMRDFLRRDPGVVDEFVGAELTQERLMRTRCYRDHARALQFSQLQRQVPHSARGTVDEHRLAAERHRAM